jgi:cytidine deaminase
VNKPTIGDRDLTSRAAALINTRCGFGRKFGDVGCRLVGMSGTVYTGVDIDTGSGTGFCAEHAAIAAMVTAGEYRIAKVVAVWRDSSVSSTSCRPGRCRELIRQIDAANLDTENILRPNRPSFGLRQIRDHARNE